MSLSSVLRLFTFPSLLLGLSTYLPLSWYCLRVRSLTAAVFYIQILLSFRQLYRSSYVQQDKPLDVPISGMIYANLFVLSSFNALKQKKHSRMCWAWPLLKLIERAARHLSFGRKNGYPRKLCDPAAATIEWNFDCVHPRRQLCSKSYLVCFCSCDTGIISKGTFRFFPLQPSVASLRKTNFEIHISRSVSELCVLIPSCCHWVCAQKMLPTTSPYICPQVQASSNLLSSIIRFAWNQHTRTQNVYQQLLSFLCFQLNQVVVQHQER
jgi:hypothetical protein